MSQKRILAYLDHIENQSISIFYSGVAPKKSNDQYYPYTVNRNFYYLTGINQAHAYLVVIKGEALTKSILFIETIDPVKALWDGAGLSFDEAIKISEVDEVKDILSFDTFFGTILSSNRTNLYGQLSSVYFDFEPQGINDIPNHVRHLSDKISKTFPYLQIHNANLILARMRTVKDQEEVETTKKALDITKDAFHHIMKKAKSSAYEHELEAEYNYILNKNQVKPSFNTIVASGVNATILHYTNNNQKLVDDGLILVDAGVELDQYCSDITRTFPKNGRFTERQKAIYEVVLEANMKTIEWVKPGITLKEFNAYGKAILIEGAKKLGLIESDEEIQKYYYHSLGHSLGLDVHDVADYTKPIEVGHILTVEPGLYIQEEGIGIRIEDDIYITEDGCINLSEGIIKTVEDIEKFMK